MNEEKLELALSIYIEENTNDCDDNSQIKINYKNKVKENLAADFQMIKTITAINCSNFNFKKFQ